MTFSTGSRHIISVALRTTTTLTYKPTSIVSPPNFLISLHTVVTIMAAIALKSQKVLEDLGWWTDEYASDVLTKIGKEQFMS